MKSKIAGLLLIALLAASCSNLNKLNLIKVNKSIKTKDITLQQNDNKEEKQDLFVSSELEQNKSENTLVIESNSIAKKVKVEDLLGFKLKDAPKTLKPALTSNISLISKLLKHKNNSENKKEMGFISFDEMSIIAVLMGICVLGVFLCIYFVPFPLSLYLVIFFVACLIGLFIYIADEVMIIKALMVLCLIGLVFCLLLLSEFGGLGGSPLIISLSIFFMAGLIGLLIYAAIKGILLDVLGFRRFNFFVR